ncbi:hypothetical protein [Massilia scottii]|uniref:hypothetical protein n=1 Tax=Massilia scottii TaxID=3057166 RepID=UPI0027966749|nr:hypothetical protein [Massilia sp. CCM 9029]MDQ1835378.1 hypothetical protein [Massilia sp. CCM 9029]
MALFISSIFISIDLHKRTILFNFPATAMRLQLHSSNHHVDRAIEKAAGPEPVMPELNTRFLQGYR